MDVHAACSQKSQGLLKLGVTRYRFNVYYAVDEAADEIVVITVRHTSRAPEFFNA